MSRLVMRPAQLVQGVLLLLVCAALLAFWVVYVQNSFDSEDAASETALMQYVLFITSFSVAMLWPALTYA